MRDINFFSPYVDKKTSFILKNKYVMVSGATLLIACSILIFSNTYRINSLEQDIQAGRIYLNSADNMTKLVKYKDAVSKLDSLIQYYQQIEGITNELDQIDIINSNLLTALSTIVPQDVFLQNLSIDTGSINISGVSRTRTAVAELLHNVKNEGLFADAFVDSINNVSKDDNNYSFTLKCKLKGVN